MAGTLENARVLDFGQYIAGPMAAMLLGDQGADVVRIDPPEGPRWKTPANATWNRNKRSIVLDLKETADLETARKLVQTADVVIENFRPGVMERLGLGSAAMTALNPRLIYCSLPGFGSDDPRAHLRAWEGVLGAATGAYRAKSNGDGRPVYTVIPYGSACGAFLCAVAVAMALIARERSGKGQRVEIPLFDATFTAIGERGLLVNGKRHERGGFRWTRQFPCKDGRWFAYGGTNKRSEAFLTEMGMAKLRDARLPADELVSKLEAITKTRTAEEWEDLCAEFGTEGGFCRTSAEWLDLPQARESEIIIDAVDPEIGKFRGPGINVRLSSTPGSLRLPRPLLNQDRDEIVRELETRKLPQIPSGEGVRSVLDGVKVLDLCIVLAGPTCGRTLAEFGADVIKIDSPYKDILRHNDINRAKRSILLDLKTGEGVEVFWRLVDRADVIIQNFRTGVAERLGLGYEEVKKRRPDIIYGSLNAFGRLGPYAIRPGHDPISQAVTGMQVRYGSKRPEMSPFPANDYGTGLMACYGIALALLHRRRTGEGQFVDTALAYTATMLQSALMQDYSGKKWDEPHGQDCVGSGPLNRAYQASNGWIFLAARMQHLKHCEELADAADMPPQAFERELERRIRQRNMAEWESLLARAGIGVHRVMNSLTEVMTDPLSISRGLSVTRTHEGGGEITTTAPGIRMSMSPPVIGRPAPRPGSDAASILAEIGLEPEIGRLIQERVIAMEGVKAA